VKTIRCYALPFLLLIAACCEGCVAVGDNVEPSDVLDPSFPDHDLEPLTACEELELATQPALGVAEVLIDAEVVGPGVTYLCERELDDEIHQGQFQTWSQRPRYRVDDRGALHFGMIGRPRVVGTPPDLCRWYPAIRIRLAGDSHAGTCDQIGGAQ
jgi:hypothetical protein